MSGTPDPKPPPQPQEPPPTDLDFCPRCGEHIEQIVWGQTNCPRCGLHFECC